MIIFLFFLLLEILFTLVLVLFEVSYAPSSIYSHWFEIFYSFKFYLESYSSMISYLSDDYLSVVSWIFDSLFTNSTEADFSIIVSSLDTFAPSSYGNRF